MNGKPSVTFTVGLSGATAVGALLATAPPLPPTPLLPVAAPVDVPPLAGALPPAGAPLAAGTFPGDAGAGCAERPPVHATSAATRASRTTPRGYRPAAAKPCT